MIAAWNVLRAEAFRLSRKRRTWVLAGLWWGLLPILAIVVARVLQLNVGGSFLDAEGGVGVLLQEIASPYGLARIALAGPAFVSPSFYAIVAALLAAALFGEERGRNHWKVTLVAQPSRLAVLAGKVALAMATFLFLMAGAALFGVLFGALAMPLLGTDVSGDWGALAGLYLRQWAHLTALVLFASLCLYLIRNTALGVVTIFFLPALIEGLYTVWSVTVGFQPVNRLNVLFQTLQLRETLENLPRYFLFDNLLLPARNPAVQLVETFAGPGEMPTGGPFAGLFGLGLTLPHASWVMVGYALVFGTLLVASFLRRDVD